MVEMRLAAYLRVSTAGQVDGYGLDAQEQAIRTWAHVHGHEVLIVCRDEGVSGTTDAVDRPGLGCALEALTLGDVEGLAVARLDRLARALTVQEAILGHVWRHGGQVFAADAGQVLQDDPDDPMRTAMRQMAGVFAQLDRQMIVKRMRDGRKAKAAAGRHSVGPYPFGYQGDGVGRERDAVPVRAEQPIIGRIVDLHAQGMPYREIVDILTAEGQRPPKGDRWHPATVRRIALRETRPTA